MKTDNHTTQKQAGFSLIEVMMAMAIFAIGMVSIFSLQILSSKGSATANHLNGSTAESSDFIEQLLVTDPAGNGGTVPGTNVSWVRIQDSLATDVDTIQVTVNREGWGAKPITISYVKYTP